MSNDLIFVPVFGKIHTPGDVLFRQELLFKNCKSNMILKCVRLWIKLTCK